LQVIVITLPGLFVPFLGGVLMTASTGVTWESCSTWCAAVSYSPTAYVAWRGHLQLWHLYAMTLITGTASAMYWATVNALVQKSSPQASSLARTPPCWSACKAGC